MGKEVFSLLFPPSKRARYYPRAFPELEAAMVWVLGTNCFQRKKEWNKSHEWGHSWGQEPLRILPPFLSPELPERSTDKGIGGRNNVVISPTLFLFFLEMQRGYSPHYPLQPGEAMIEFRVGRSCTGLIYKTSSHTPWLCLWTKGGSSGGLRCPRG